ncbi:MAG: hypothetical protein H7246_01565 [Phycisphaerae bacterium]|nr:hypothetical protein [Saprospiraceae bacterium]
MNRFALLLLSASMMLAISCKYILLKSEGVKQPALESHKSLSKFLLSKGIDTSEILCFRDTFALNTFYRTSFKVPDAHFFNKDKKFVDYRQSIKDCNGMVSVFIENIDSVNLELPIEGKFLDDYLNNLVIEKTGHEFVLENQEYDVYMVVYWAKYLGKVNKRKVYDWQELVKKAKQNGKRIRTLLVSVDYQEMWGISKDQIPEFDY